VPPDPVAGTLLSLTGDLADANVRLQRAGVTRALRSRLRPAGPGRARLEDTWTGEQREVACAAVVDCGHRLADTALYEAAGYEAAGYDEARPGPGQSGVPRAGDCVAPRTAAEAVLEGRRRAQEIGALEAGDPETGAPETGALDTSALEREQPPPATPAPDRQPAAR